MGRCEVNYLIPIVKSLRDRGISCEIFPESSKLKKQFDYASRKNIPFISICGETEVESCIVNLKNLNTGEQKSFSHNDIEGMAAFLSL